MKLRIQNVSALTDDNSTAHSPFGAIRKAARRRISCTPAQFTAAKADLDTLVTASKIVYSIAQVDVAEMGARGDGVTDDTAAIQAAFNLMAAKGGTVFFPRPAVCYRVTGRITVGNRWLGEADIKYVAGGAWDITAQASYNLTLRNAATSLAPISISADPGTEIWGDFAPGTETCIMVYGVTNALAQGAQSATIKNLTFVGPTGYSSAAPVFPSGATTITTNVSGLCVLGSSVRVQGCGARELSRGFVSYASYWSKWEHLRALHCLTGFELQGHNAAHASNLRAEYCQNYGLVVTGQGFTVGPRYDTEQCAVDFYVPSCDRGTITDTYLEAVGASFTDYTGKIGDPSAASSTQVVGLTLKNVHGSRDYGRHLKLHSAQVVAEGCRLYQTNANSLTLLNNVYSSLMKQDSDLPIDPAGFPDRAFRRGVVSHVDGFGITQSTGDTTNGGNARANTTGLTFGIQHIWYDATHGHLRTKQGTPSDQHDGKAITAISSQGSSTAFANMANGVTVELSFTGLPNVAAGDCIVVNHRPGGVAAVPGLVWHGRCDVAGTIVISLTNLSGTTFNVASSSVFFRVSYWSNLG